MRLSGCESLDALWPVRYEEGDGGEVGKSY